MAGTLAIDLGSTTTVVAYQPPGGEPQLLALPPFSLENPPVVPSLVWLAGATSPRPLIGRQVMDAGLLHHGGPQLHQDFKRLIGATGGSEAPPTDGPGGKATTVALPLPPEAAASLLLQQVWQALPEGLQPERLVLTAPIEGYRGYRQWLLRTCASMAVPEVALVDEPTAAAIGAGLPPGSTVLVVDLGGGTIDLSLVRLEGGEGRAAPIAQLLRFAGRDLAESRQALRCASVIGKAGIALGGRDIDRWIARSLCPDPAAAEAHGASLLEAAERLKIALSSREEALVLCSPPGGTALELRLTRPELDALLVAQGLMAELDHLLEKVLAAGRRAGIGLGEITAVLPVGGSSRLRLVREWLASRCGGVAIRGERPVEAVALGALALTPGVQVRDVLSHGVSLRCWEQRSGRHQWHPLFVAGQSWPTDRPLELVLACSQDGQPDMELLFGEPLEDQRREVVFEAGLPVLRPRPAGSAPVRAWDRQPCPLPLSPAGERGVDRLRLAFRIEADRQLVVEVSDLLTGLPSGPIQLGPVR
jgi:molecular chaperone DnaK (HSP70)